jgi:hypothetical protein
MQQLLDEVEDGRITAKTKRGIKGAITRRATLIALQNVEDNMDRVYGVDWAMGAAGSQLIEAYQQHRLNVIR